MSQKHENSISSALVAARLAQKLRQEDVASAAGISRRALIMIEAGGDCSLRTLQRIMGALNLKMDIISAARPGLDQIFQETEAELLGTPPERPRA